MSFADAFTPAEAMYSAQVLYDTFGHLEPEKGKKYPGYIVFCQSETGDLITIRSDFEGVTGGPGMYWDMNDFVCEKAKKRGAIYRFDGTLTRLKKGKCRFVGKIVELEV